MPVQNPVRKSTRWLTACPVGTGTSVQLASGRFIEPGSTHIP